MIGQPLLYLLILGQGIASGLTLNRAPGVGYLQFMYPGILGMSVLFTSIFSAMSIIWDREFGFLKEVLVAPVPRWAVAVGKILGGATVAVVPVDDPDDAGAARRRLSLAADGRGTAAAVLPDQRGHDEPGRGDRGADALDAGLPDDHELPGDAAVLPERGDVPAGTRRRPGCRRSWCSTR